MIKHQFFQFIAWLLLNVSAFAQVNASFESLNNTSDNSRAFSRGFVNGWLQSHGTPTIINGGAPLQGSRAAWMWSHNGGGEGIVQDYNFQAGENYLVIFWVKTNNPDGNIFVKAANGVPAGVSDRSTFPNVSSQQTIFTDGLNYPEWKRVSIEFTPNTNFSQLWIHPYLGGRPTRGQAEFMIDGIEIIEETCTVVSTVPVPNPSFEELTSFSTNYGNAFAEGLVAGWRQSHGRPRLAQHIPGLRPFSASVAALGGSSSGIVTNVEVKAGETYDISLWVTSTASRGRLFVKLANGVPYGTSTAPQIPSVAETQTLINATGNFGAGATVTVPFTADKDYSQLWIYAELNDFSPALVATIDHISIKKEVCTFISSRSRTTSQIIEESQVLRATIYPNPTNEKIKLTLPATTEEAQVRLINVATGQQVASFNATHAHQEWPIPSNVKNGTY